MNEYAAYRRRLCLRPDAHLAVRPDAHLFRLSEQSAAYRPVHPDDRKHLWAELCVPDLPQPPSGEAELRAWQASLTEAKALLAELHRELARARLNRKYSPDQPRVPAGNPDGGQWTRDGGGNRWTPLAPPTAAVQRNPTKRPHENPNPVRLAQLTRPSGVVGDATNPEFSPDQPGWHKFSVGPNLACRSELRCSPEEIADQLPRFSLPGRDPANPVMNGERSVVYDPRNGLPGGWVTTLIENDGLTVINRTSPLHVFYDGVVIRSAHQAADGSWYVSTFGFGNNVLPGMNIYNEKNGPAIFTLLDERMRENIERHHAKGMSRMAVRDLDGGNCGRGRTLLAGSSHAR